MAVALPEHLTLAAGTLHRSVAASSSMSIRCLNGEVRQMTKKFPCSKKPKRPFPWRQALKDLIVVLSVVKAVIEALRVLFPSNLV